MAETSSKKPGFFSKVKNWFKGIGKFFRDTASEMKKVVWPSKKQIINNTIVVIVVVIIAAIVVLALDLLGVVGMRTSGRNTIRAGSPFGRLPALLIPAVLAALAVAACALLLGWYGLLCVLMLPGDGGALEALMEAKEQGRIRHLGFSAHGSLDVMKRFLNAYGQHMEFCQIQLNYLDWTLQDAKAKVELLNAHHIPIWVMEPLRGGKLAALSQEDAAALQALRPAESIPGWAFRFLQSIPGVTMILSGMSSMPQLQDNVRHLCKRTAAERQ